MANIIMQNVPGSALPSEIPSGYTQLKYVESSGTQGINTGVAPTIDIELQIQGVVLQGNGAYYAPGGCTNPPVSVCSQQSPTATSIYNSFGNVSDKQITTRYWSDVPPTMVINKTTAKIICGDVGEASVSLGATTMSGSADTRIGLFCRGNGANFERYAHWRIYRAKIYENGTLIRDFVPAMKNDTEEIGMYDIAGNSFYQNIGTGVFAGGAR